MINGSNRCRSAQKPATSSQRTIAIFVMHTNSNDSAIIPAAGYPYAAAWIQFFSAGGGG